MLDQWTIKLIAGLHPPSTKRWIRHLKIALIVVCYLAMAAAMVLAARNTSL
jgi:hypothetical protein